MIYAVTEEGIAALRELAGVLSEKADEIGRAARALEGELEQNIAGLGVHGESIAAMIAEVRQAQTQTCLPVFVLADRVNALADSYEEFVYGDRFRAPGSAASAGGSGGAAGSGGGAHTIKSISGWIKQINPKYPGPFNPLPSAYRVNCGACAFAVEARLNGDSTAVAGAKNIGTDAGMEKATGKECRYMEVSQIEAILKERGPGAHLIVGVNRNPTPSGKSQSGHWFNAFYDGEKVYTLEGQSGKIYDWPHDYGDVSEWCALV